MIMQGIIRKICTVVEVGCILGLAGIALKRNNDAYNAEIELNNTKCELTKARLYGVLKEAEVWSLEKELEIK